MSRTIVETPASPIRITPDSRITMLGSCFTDNVGSRLEADGYSVVHNPMGPLFNPASIASVVCRREPYAMRDLRQEPDGVWHCLAYASRYLDADADALLARVNAEFSSLRHALDEADVLIFTFGTAFVFEEIATDRIVGNCHRIPARAFRRCRLSIDEIVELWRPLMQSWSRADKRPAVIFTVSPIRHTADTLHGNNLSKAILHLAIDQLVAEYDFAEYFPAFEAVIDDLRDYTFYADDMKHPAPEAVDYIYQIFNNAYISHNI